jgi:hemerythrin-like metal-binding protein
MNANATTALPPRAVISRQHESIDARLESFALKVHAGTDRAGIADAMRDLLVDMSMHFGYEESLMDLGDYAEFDHHRRQHLAMMTELGLLLDRIDEASETGAALLRDVDFLRLWYQRHVASSDSKLDDWLAASFAV